MNRSFLSFGIVCILFTLFSCSLSRLKGDIERLVANEEWLAAAEKTLLLSDHLSGGEKGVAFYNAGNYFYRSVTQQPKDNAKNLTPQAQNTQESAEHTINRAIECYVKARLYFNPSNQERLHSIDFNCELARNLLKSGNQDQQDNQQDQQNQDQQNSQQDQQSQDQQNSQQDQQSQDQQKNRQDQQSQDQQKNQQKQQNQDQQKNQQKQQNQDQQKYQQDQQEAQKSTETDESKKTGEAETIVSQEELEREIRRILNQKGGIQDVEKDW